MAEHDCTWARLVDMAHGVYPDDPDLDALHAMEAFAEEQTVAYGHQAEQLEAEALVAEVEAEGRAFALTL
jgi:hypothetical protein